MKVTVAGSFRTARNSHILKATKRRITVNNFICLSAILFLVGINIDACLLKSKEEKNKGNL